MLNLRKGVGTNQKLNLKDKAKGTNPISEWKLKLTNEITNDSIEGVITLDTSNPRYDIFLISNSVISGYDALDDGSHTFVVTGDDIVYAQGKAIVYDGTYSTETKFGDEVTYTEHDNTYSNTQYITI